VASPVEWVVAWEKEKLGEVLEAVSGVEWAVMWEVASERA
jgi:hypothetical protein